MLIITKNTEKLITIVEGTGDNLTAEDIKDGFNNYWMSSIYERDGEDIKLIDSGQILTGTPIADMEEEEMLKRIFDYWEVGDPESREADYVILERS